MVIFRLKNVFEYTAYNHKIGKYSRSVTHENLATSKTRNTGTPEHRNTEHRNTGTASFRNTEHRNTKNSKFVKNSEKKYRGV